jgi:sigma-B regulation protein RsbU (phosphoserine phosphatase)
MFTVGDVADRGIQGALVTATARAALRSAAHSSLSASEALSHSNELLCPEMQPGNAVTCLYAVLDPADGRLDFAKAGDLTAYHTHSGDVEEFETSGQPLGLALASQYEQREVTIDAGECVVFATDGLIQAQNSDGEPFGVPRLKAILEKETSCSQALVDALLSELKKFTDDDWVQEDDITLLVLEHTAEDHPEEAGREPGGPV